MQQKLFQIFLSQEAGGSGNNIERKSQKPRPKLKKKFIHRNVWSACNPVQLFRFCKPVVIL